MSLGTAGDDNQGDALGLSPKRGLKDDRLPVGKIELGENPSIFQDSERQTIPS